MKRKKKLILVGILGVAYIVIALNFHKIKFAFSMFRLYSNEKKIETIDDNKPIVLKPPVDNPLDIIIDSVDIVGKADETLDKDNGTVDKPGDNEDTSGETDKDDKKEVVDDKTKKSYKTIINEYNAKLEDLKKEFEGELDNLIAEGIKDYQKGDLSTTQLASRYLSTGAKLEKISDGKFNLVVKDMEKELKANGHDTGIVKEVKNYYNDFKDAKKTNLINRGMKHV